MIIFFLNIFTHLTPPVQSHLTQDGHKPSNVITTQGVNMTYSILAIYTWLSMMSFYISFYWIINGISPQKCQVCKYPSFSCWWFLTKVACNIMFHNKNMCYEFIWFLHLDVSVGSKISHFQRYIIRSVRENHSLFILLHSPSQNIG